MMNQQEMLTAYANAPVSMVSVEERMAFLRKVYSLLSASLLTGALGAWLARGHQDLDQAGPLFVPVVSNMILFIVLEIGLVFFAMWARRKPGLNMVALFSFTTVSGLTLGPIFYRYAGGTIIEALVLTFGIFAGLSLYVIFSKKDFSFMSGFLMTGLIILVVGGLLNMFLQNSMLHFLFSGVGVFLFSGFILYDTSNIMRTYGTDEYVSATLALYLDILNLFISLLQLLGMSKD